MTTAKGGKPIGQRIRSVCAALEKHGPSTAKALHALEPQITAADVTKYARRAAAFGFVAIDRSTWPHTYAANPRWLFMADQRTKVVPIPPPAPRFIRQLPPNSVFQLGERAGASA